jgi:hypothetical protein
MQRPSCALCKRIGAECVYPTTRKPKSSRRPRRDVLQGRNSLARETQPVQDLQAPETDLWSSLFVDTDSQNQPLPPQSSNKNGSVLEASFNQSTEDLDLVLSYASPFPRNAAVTTMTETRSSGEEPSSLRSLAECNGFDPMPLSVFFDDDALLALTGETGAASWLNNDQGHPTLLSSSTSPPSLQTAENQSSNNDLLVPTSSFRNNGSLSTDGDDVAPQSPTQLDTTAEKGTEL